MKSIDRYILEKYQITKDSKNPYTCHPKDKFELRKILEGRLAEDKDADLNDIDVSLITDMGSYKFVDNKGLFENLDPHNINISKWDVSNVTDMAKMFWKCENLNCDLSNWDVSNVKYMYGMFLECENFEGEGLEKWNPIKCKDINSMFYGCENFNCDLNNWNVSNVEDMCWMFNYCYSLKNKPSWYKN